MFFGRFAMIEVVALARAGMEESMSLANEVILRDTQVFCVLFEAQGCGLLWGARDELHACRQGAHP
jgi:hypothetical protein